MTDNQNIQTAENTENTNKTNDKIYWHDAFYAAYKMEFHEYAEYLEFIDEFQLSEEALIMDVLVLKKRADISIHRSIGKIFRTYNITEYKSETDRLKISDYHKVMAYAFLYATFKKVPLSEITLTFVISKHPRSLLKYLKTERRLAVRKVESGLYYVEEDVFPIQILESGKLDEINVFLKYLRSGLSVREMASLFSHGSKMGVLDSKNPYFDRVIRANPAEFREVIEMSEETKKIVFWALETTGALAERDERIVAERVAERDIEMAQKMLSFGDSAEKVMKIVGLPKETIENLRTTT